MTLGLSATLILGDSECQRVGGRGQTSFHMWAGPSQQPGSFLLLWASACPGEVMTVLPLGVLRGPEPHCRVQAWSSLPLPPCWTLSASQPLSVPRFAHLSTLMTSVPAGQVAMLSKGPL